MNFDIMWNEKYYEEFITYLYSLADLKYKEFHSKLILDNNLIGIRTPILKKIAKEISKYDYKGFFKYNTHKLYEECLIHGLVIGYLKDYNEVIIYLNDFFRYINNWATCDLTCSNLKIFEKNMESGFNYISDLIKSTDSFKIRVGLVLLNDYYVNVVYIDSVLKIVDNVNSSEYYVKMAIAWLLSTCYIKYSDKTYNYLLNSNLDNWTYNKTIDKIKDSKRVGDNSKKELNKLKK